MNEFPLTLHGEMTILPFRSVLDVLLQVLVAYAMTFIGALAITLPLYKSLVVLNVIQFVWGVHGVFYDASKCVSCLCAFPHS